MDWIEALKGFASVTTVAAAIMVASNLSPKIMVAGFATFIVASLAWIAAGWIENQPSLYIQNIVLLLVNIVGVVRWAPRVEQGEGSA